MDKKQKDKNTEEQLVHEFNSSSGNSKGPKAKIVIFILVVGVFGLVSGLLIAKGTSKPTISSASIQSPADIEVGQEIGSGDLSIFKDTAEGVLLEGGIEGEGQFHLKRPGGEDQFVYLTSSSVDLSLLEGRKIKVWGETFASEKAGWLMDVGRVEVLE